MTNEMWRRTMMLAKSSADMAIDQFGDGREYATLDEAVESYSNNIRDTLLDWGVKATRDHNLAQAVFEAALIERGCVKRWVKP